MGKDGKLVPAAEPTYGEVVNQLEAVVQRLEGGELSLEDSIREFETGVRLVRQGEKLLGAAERRVEELLKEGNEERVAPLEIGGPVAAPAGKNAPKGQSSARGGRATYPSDEGDIPF